MRWLVICVVACGHHDVAPAPGSSAAPVPGSADSVAHVETAACEQAPVVLGEGLVAERHPLGAATATGADPCFDVVRADLARYRLRVFTLRDGDTWPAPRWRDHYHLVAVINAGMFHESGEPVGQIIEAGSDVGIDNKKMSGFLAFDPVSASDPPVAIGGRGCPGFDAAALRQRYRSVVQSYRLLQCDGTALPWQDPKQYSAAAIGVDRTGRIVFIHSRGAVTMSELARALAPLDLTGALFLEGGPEASLVVRGDRGELSRVGSFETGFVENDGNTAFWPLPNVIALAPAQAP